MKLIFSALAAVLMALGLCPRAIAQGAMVLLPSGTNAFLGQTFSTNVAPRKLADLLSTNSVPGCPNRSLFDFSRRGVYRSEPYTMIVVVPGGHADDHSIVGSSGSVPYMPTHRPELRLIPWGQGNTRTKQGCD